MPASSSSGSHGNGRSMRAAPVLKRTRCSSHAVQVEVVLVPVGHDPVEHAGAHVERAGGERRRALLARHERAVDPRQLAHDGHQATPRCRALRRGWRRRARRESERRQPLAEHRAQRPRDPRRRLHAGEPAREVVVEAHERQQVELVDALREQAAVALGLHEHEAVAGVVGLGVRRAVVTRVAGARPRLRERPADVAARVEQLVERDRTRAPAAAARGRSRAARCAPAARRRGGHADARARRPAPPLARARAARRRAARRPLLDLTASPPSPSTIPCIRLSVGWISSPGRSRRSSASQARMRPRHSLPKTAIERVPASSGRVASYVAT